MTGITARQAELARDAFLHADHDLKLAPEHFVRVQDRSKTFEIRKNDKGYEVGQVVLLREFDQAKPEGLQYSGRAVAARIGHISTFSQREGYIVFSLLDVVHVRVPGAPRPPRTLLRAEALQSLASYVEALPPQEPFVEREGGEKTLYLLPSKRFRLTEETTSSMAYGLDRDEMLGQLGVSGGEVDSRAFAESLLAALHDHLCVADLENLADVFKQAYDEAEAQRQKSLAGLDRKLD